MRFRDRRDAGRRLGAALSRRLSEDSSGPADAESGPVVLGLPRGGVPVAAEVAAATGGSLDVLIVRKLGAPGRPELAMGALGEGGVLVRNDDVVAAIGCDEATFADVERRERAELERRVQRYRQGAALTPLAGRLVLVVDDGIATGATVRAACQVVRTHRPARLLVAAPVAAPGSARLLADVADGLEVLQTPAGFAGVGQFYRDFRQTSDDEVVQLLRG